MNTKAINVWGIFALFVLLIIAGILNFFGSQLPLGNLDAQIGCPVQAIPLFGGLIGGFVGCGFMSVFNLIVFVAAIALLIFTFTS